MPVVSDYTALLSGSYWGGIEVIAKPVIITYSFPVFAPAYDQAVVGNTAFSTFSSFTAGEKTQAQNALSQWSAASGITFVQVEPGSGDINFGLFDFSTISGVQTAGGFGFYPFGVWNFASYPYFTSDLDAAGDVYINSNFISGGNIPIALLLHEIGHAIGLKHPTETVVSAASTTHDQVLASGFNPNLTIMSQASDGPSTLTSLSALDMAAAAAIYGPAGAKPFAVWSFDAPSQTFHIRDFTGGGETRGTSVNDYIVAGAAANRIYGLSGNDTIFGGNLGDSIDGGAGNDYLVGGLGADTLIGGTGNDRLYSGGGLAALLRPGTGSNIVYGHGNDTLDYSDLTASAYVELGAGFVTHDAGTATDYITGVHNVIGTAFGDRIYGTAGADNIFDGAGNDIIYAKGGNDTINAGDGNNIISGSGTIFTGTGNDFVENLTALASYIVTGSGNDTVRAGSGGDLVYGGNGNDYLFGGAGNDTFHPGTGFNVFFGGGGSDMVDYSDLAASAYIDLNNERVTHDGGAAVDIVSAVDNAIGTSFDDRIYGRAAGHAFLNGGGGNDTIYAIGPQDTLYGGAGDDALVSAGGDFLLGQGGNNRFYIGNSLTAGDVIGDYVTGIDKLYFRELTNSGTYLAGQSVFIANGTGTIDQIFGAHNTQGFAYDTANHNLYFDLDGSGGANSAVYVATLTGVNALSSSDIVIYNG